MYRLFSIPKIDTSCFHPKNGNDDVERVNHAMAHMLAMGVDERQNDKEKHLRHVNFDYNVIAVIRSVVLRQVWL